jgi:hypothetical protein
MPRLGLQSLMQMLLVLLFACGAPDGDPGLWDPRDWGRRSAALTAVSGELKRWHRVTLTFDGPSTAENASPNPSRDYRLQVTFSKGARSIAVPGYYAADGNAAESSATSGNKWRVHFVPDEEGTWTYAASFRQGTDVAVSLVATAGTPASFDGASGSFTVAATDKSGRDFRGQGLLGYVGEHYLQFAGTEEHFLQGGAGSPENFLAYADFDQTPASHVYAPHAGDWVAGDPTWKGSKGKNIVGALNYLASQGMNSVYFLTMNVNGDGQDVWPWTASGERYRFDVSKLDQWEIVFSHMDKKGIQLHVVTQEQENDQLLDGGALGLQRKLYYRELVARFGHHLAVIWNLGEENTNTDPERKAFAEYFHDLDPYDHPVMVHTFTTDCTTWPPSDHCGYETVYNPLLGDDDHEGASLQVGSPSGVHAETIKWIDRSAGSTPSRPWVVNLDEIGPSSVGVATDATDPGHDVPRKQALWGNLMAGGGGVAWYFGSGTAHNDLNCEDWRSRDAMWDQTRHALDFFQQDLPFASMQHDDALTSNTSDYCLAKPGEVYAVYLPSGGTTNLNLGTNTGSFTVRWYNPRTGGSLQTGSVATVTGPGQVSLGTPPSGSTSDWAVVVEQSGSLSVTSLALINADTDQPIAGYNPIAEGATLNLNTLPTRNLNIRANTNPGTVGSVRFAYDGNSNYRTENQGPYALAGDTSGDYHAWTPTLGSKTLTATPYTGASAGGTAGTALTRHFTVIDQ